MSISRLHQALKERVINMHESELIFITLLSALALELRPRMENVS